MRATLRQAVEDGDLAFVRRELDAGASLDDRDRSGQTMLMLAARRGHGDLVAELVARGAALDVTAKHGLSALMLAVVNGHVDVARDLVAAGVDVTLRGTGAPGLAGRTAADLARDRGLGELLPR
jgi:ankyrin repeat protein